MTWKRDGMWWDKEAMCCMMTWDKETVWSVMTWDKEQYGVWWLETCGIKAVWCAMAWDKRDMWCVMTWDTETVWCVMTELGNRQLTVNIYVRIEVLWSGLLIMRFQLLTPNFYYWFIYFYLMFQINLGWFLGTMSLSPLPPLTYVELVDCIHTATVPRWQSYPSGLPRKPPQARQIFLQQNAFELSWPGLAIRKTSFI